MVFIKNSTLTYEKNTRLAYDFFIWDSICIIGVLLIPYVYHIFKGDI